MSSGELVHDVPEELRQLRHEVRLLKDHNAILEARCASLETGLREWLASTIEHPFAGLRALLDDGLTPSRIHTARSAMRAGRVTPKKEHCE